MDLLKRSVETRRHQWWICNPRNFQLLEFLMRHADQVVTRTMLLEGVWDYHFDPRTNVIDVHISNLRAKIDRGSRSRCCIPSAARDTDLAWRRIEARFICSWCLPLAAAAVLALAVAGVPRIASTI